MITRQGTEAEARYDALLSAFEALPKEQQIALQAEWGFLPLRTVGDAVRLARAMRWKLDCSGPFEPPTQEEIASTLRSDILESVSRGGMREFLGLVYGDALPEFTLTLTQEDFRKVLE